MALSSKKKNSFLSQVLQHEELVNELKEFHQKKFEKTFGKCLLFGKFSYYTCIQPYEYPIFDRHVYRAYRFIQNLDESACHLSNQKDLNYFMKSIVLFLMIWLG